jgi:hypothetical protein
MRLDNKIEGLNMACEEFALLTTSKTKQENFEI